jgi:hypothetical protein
LRGEVKFLQTDLSNLKKFGEDGIGLAEDAAVAKEIFSLLQGEIEGLTKNQLVALIVKKRELEESIDDVTDAFARQEAATETIDALIMKTGLLAEQFAIASTGGSLADIQALQQARQIVADLGEDTEFTVEEVKQLILQEKALNDALKGLDISKVDQLESSLATIRDLQGAENLEDSAIAQLALQAKSLEDQIVAAQLAAAGLDPDVILGVIPDETQIRDAMAPFVALMDRGILTPEQLELVAAGIEEKVKGSFDAMTEFAIQAARNIESALADFLYDPFSDGLDGMLVSFGETLRKMTSDLLANAILQKFLSSFGDSSGILGAVAGAIGGNADGGPVQSGKPTIVGERGPELLVPRQAGQVISNEAMTGGQAAPQVNVGGPTIVNTLDDGAIVSAFNRGGGSDVILNNMTENKAAFRSALGINN